MSRSKFFRVAVEGATVDGRVIERNWLTEMAASYNRATYAARVNMEHIRGITADKPFKAYGDVLSLRTEEVEIELDGKQQKKLALFAEIEPTDELVAMNRDKQKLYTSIEVNPNFATTGKAYLVGLAVTDSPASLGTEILTFAVKHPGVMRHGPTPQAEGNVFSLGLETSFELADGTAGDDPYASEEAKGFFSAAGTFFKGLTAAAPPQQQAAPVVEPPAPAADAAADPRFKAFADGIDAMTKGIEAQNTAFTTALAALQADVAKLARSIDTTDGHPDTRRAPAAGTAAQFATDC